MKVASALLAASAWFVFPTFVHSLNNGVARTPGMHVSGCLGTPLLIPPPCSPWI
jgi:hypothetical protein